MIRGAVVAIATCAEHGREALGPCGRCGNFVCASCGTTYGHQVLCAACLERVGYSAPHSPRSVVAVVLGLLSVAGLLPLGVVALLLGYAELRDIRNGSRPGGGRWFAQAAVLFGWISSVMLCLAIAALTAAVVLGSPNR